MCSLAQSLIKFSSTQATLARAGGGSAGYLFVAGASPCAAARSLQVSGPSLGGAGRQRCILASPSWLRAATANLCAPSQNPLLYQSPPLTQPDCASCHRPLPGNLDTQRQPQQAFSRREHSARLMGNAGSAPAPERTFDSMSFASRLNATASGWPQPQLAFRRCKGPSAAMHSPSRCKCPADFCSLCPKAMAPAAVGVTTGMQEDPGPWEWRSP